MGCVRHCLYAGENSVSSTARVKKDTIPYICNGKGFGFSCGFCFTFNCRQCLRVLRETVLREAGIHAIQDECWLEVEHYFNDQYYVPKMCPCCWIKKQAKAQLAVETLRPMTRTELSPMKFDGYLVFPEFAFAVDSPMHGRCQVDVHGLGGDSDASLNAPFHFVIGSMDAIIFAAQKVSSRKVPTGRCGVGNIERFCPFPVSIEKYDGTGTIEVSGYI